MYVQCTHVWPYLHMYTCTQVHTCNVHLVRQRARYSRWSSWVGSSSKKIQQQARSSRCPSPNREPNSTTPERLLTARATTRTHTTLARTTTERKSLACSPVGLYTSVQDPRAQWWCWWCCCTVHATGTCASSAVTSSASSVASRPSQLC